MPNILNKLLGGYNTDVSDLKASLDSGVYWPERVTPTANYLIDQTKTIWLTFQSNVYANGLLYFEGATFSIKNLNSVAIQFGWHDINNVDFFTTIQANTTKKFTFKNNLWV